MIILRCPFCDSMHLRQGVFKDIHYIKCTYCEAIGPKSPSQHEAIKNWNRRKNGKKTNEDGLELQADGSYK
jgi:Lar family restriction alleviation protein